MKRLDLFTNASTFIKVPFPSIKGADLMPALSEMVDFNVDMAVLQAELQQTLVKWQDHSSRQVMTMLGKTIIVVIVVVLTTAVVIVVSAKRIHKNLHLVTQKYGRKMRAFLPITPNMTPKAGKRDSVILVWVPQIRHWGARSQTATLMTARGNSTSPSSTWDHKHWSPSAI